MKASASHPPDAAAGTAAPVTVFAHVHYPEIWREMGPMIAERLDRPFRLVLTHTGVATELFVPSSAHLVSVTTIAVENRGRDIRPFLEAVAQAPDFDIGLKLHTKKSPQRADGEQWRADLLNALVPPGGVGAIVDQLRADPRIGIVAPAGFCLSVDPWIDVNAPGMVKVMATLGHALTEHDLDDTYFAAGSMFWFRRAGVATLAAAPVLELFETETGQVDGTIGHAVERLFPVEARRQGFLSCAVPALLASRPSDAPAALRELARRHADIPTRYFPGPGIPAAAPCAADAGGAGPSRVQKLATRMRGLFARSRRVREEAANQG